MAPRMKLPTKGKGKAPATFHHHLFVSKEAEELYNNVYSSRSLISKRGFDLKGQILEKVGVEIEKRGWNQWAQQSVKGKMELARQFYANLHESKMDKVWLLGRWVSFLAKDINRVLGIPEVKQAEEISRMRVDEMTEVLCPEGIEWIIKTGRLRHFLKRDTSPEVQAWLYFICARLLPAKHYTEVNPDRCRVIYGIMEGYPINVGKIIYREMIKVTSQKHSLPFPTVITLMSIAAGPEEGYEPFTYVRSLPPIT